jgi:hypothetical protein
MKKDILKLSYVALASAMVIMGTQSCNKKDDGPATNYNSPAEVLADLAPDVQSFTLDVSKENVITGEDGTVITIPANAFVDANGNPVQGVVTMDLKEVLSLGDQFTSGAFAVSDGKLLNSGGEFYLKFTAGGQELTLADNKSIDVQIPTDNVDSNMTVYTGTTVSNNPLENDTSGSTVNWQVAVDTTTNDSATYKDPSELYFATEMYVMKIYELYQNGWYNVDYYANYDELLHDGKCSVVVADNKDDEEIELAFQFIYKGFNSVCTLYSWDKKTVVGEQNFELSGYWVKNQTPVLVVMGVGKKSKKLYFGKVSVQITEGVEAKVQLNSISKEALSQELDYL